MMKVLEMDRLYDDSVALHHLQTKYKRDRLQSDKSMTTTKDITITTNIFMVLTANAELNIFTTVCWPDIINTGIILLPIQRTNLINIVFKHPCKLKQNNRQRI